MHSPAKFADFLASVKCVRQQVVRAQDSGLVGLRPRAVARCPLWHAACGISPRRHVDQRRLRRQVASNAFRKDARVIAAQIDRMWQVHYGSKVPKSRLIGRLSWGPEEEPDP